MQTIETRADYTGWQQIEALAATSRGISTSEAARRAGVSPSTIRRWIRLGHLEATRTPAGYVVDASGLDAARDAARARRRSTQEDRVVAEQPSTTRAARPLTETPAELPAATLHGRGAATPAAPVHPAPQRRHAAHIERARVLEGLQRGIILEQAKYQRAARRKDQMAMRDSAWRIEALFEQLHETQEDERERRARDREPRVWPERLRSIGDQPRLAALASAAAIAKTAPSRRTFDVAALLILNGFLMMLMTFIA
ncbi:MAG TPA: MerR family DNA-binding transcriptional regulator [Thermomicrobiales bacterium]|nr:MerR family DNA-binding transcriptional regulator [Thermomicrobiales bacterium]